jgi:DNA-binding response OmpR family regulator
VPRRPEPTPEEHAGPAPRPRGKHRTFRLLLVDHEPQVHTLLTEALDGDGLQVLHADTLGEARQRLAAETVDLILVEPNLKDGSGLELAEEVSRSRPATQTIVISSQPSLQRAVAAIRAGAADFIAKPLDIGELNERVRQALGRRRRDLDLRQRTRRLRRVCQKLSRARAEVVQQVDVLCNDLVTAYQELAGQMNQVVRSREFAAVIQQELDLEQLIRKVLQFLLDKAGPINAALFLPTGSDEFALGGYINYDWSAGSADMVLHHLADVVAPRVAQEPDLIHITDNPAMQAWLGADAAYLADSHVLACAVRHRGEVLAVIVLFRDGTQPFSGEFVESLGPIAHTLGEYLARVIRIHHRHLPLEEA